MSMKTTDIWFASFLRMHAVPLTNFTVVKAGKGSYEFDVSEARWKELRLLFDKSEVSKIKQIQLSLKDLLH